MISQKFNINLTNLPKITSIDSPTFRMYTDGSGSQYPSVTSVLSITAKNSIENWKKAVGEEESNRISATASWRGSLVHDTLERFIRGEDINTSKLHPIVKQTFIPIRNFLIKNVSDIMCIEGALISHKLKVGGRTDLVARIGNELHIIDFKSSRSQKTEDKIHSYYMQASCYAYMFKELTGVEVKKFSILISPDGSGHVDVFTGKTKDYIKDFIDVRKKFKEEFNI